MMKPASLRAALTAADAELSTNPDKLVVFVDEGTIASTNAKSLSFEYRYKLHIIVTDYAGNPDSLFACVIEWAAKNQRDLLENVDRRKDGIVFEADQLNHTTYDLSIKVRLTESVIASRDADGKLSTAHKPEPVPEWEIQGLV